MDAFFQFIY
jgi:hypothetical protein